MADNYVCSLNAASIKKAKKELNEDAKERMGVVETFRKWIQDQPHLTCPTDTAYLLRTLRFAHFSQLEARKILDKYFTFKSQEPQWMNNLDTHDKKMNAVLNMDYFNILPGVNDEGRKVFFVIPHNLDTESKEIDRNALLSMFFSIVLYILMTEENVQVNGFEFVMDLGDINYKYLNFLGLDTMKRVMGAWTGAVPIRQKVFHHYNPGPLFEAIFALFKPIMPKKHIDRIIMHSTAEKLYKKVPMRLLPREYLPDDYKGPCPGTLREIKEKFMEGFRRPEIRARLLEETKPEYGVDESKRPEDIPQASFRKLNVD